MKHKQVSLGSRVAELFSSCITAGPESRRLVLERESGDDLELRSQVEQLLRVADQAWSKAQLSEESGSLQLSGRKRDEPLILPTLRLECPEVADLMVQMYTTHFQDKGEAGSIWHRVKSSLDRELCSLNPGSQLGRYVLKEILGVGGFGLVFRAFDTRHGTSVALKVLRKLTPGHLVRLKREFRVLADVVHPHLVQLYELGYDSGQYYLTMEFVDGVDFLSYLRSCGRSGLVDQQGGVACTTPREQQTAVESSPESGLAETKLTCLMRLLVQLAEGVTFLHQRGILHRDLKPSNVLITPEGRLVILDFGLAAEVSADGVYESTAVVGTVPYMAPEQAAGEPVTRASDWYSFGCILYEALTGRVPFTHCGGGFGGVRRGQPAPRPGEWVAGVPADLDQLCFELLHSDAPARPEGAEILRRLTRSTAPASGVIPGGPETTERRLLVGRDRELSILRRAWQEVAPGRATVVHVFGLSGMGKTSLARQFLDRLKHEDSRVVVLSGRCYQQELVPFKAVDGVIDELSRFLNRQADGLRRMLLPRDTTALGVLFPAVRSLVGLTGDEGSDLCGLDPQELRRRAFGTLRELFRRITDLQPVVIFIDDLQWGDADSVRLLLELLHPPDVPGLMLLLSYRQEDIGGSPALKEYLAGLPEYLGDSVLHDVEVGELPLKDAEQLAAGLLKDRPASEIGKRALKEAGGNPYLICELAQQAQMGPDEVGVEFTLDAILWRRAARLPEEALRLLAVTSVSGCPVDFHAACEAAGVLDTMEVLGRLRSERLVRVVPLEAYQALDTYHDRIRESVMAHLGEAQVCYYHRELALALECSGRGDSEALARHWEAAAEMRVAEKYYGLAAEQAVKALAFNHASDLYRRLIQCAERSGTPCGDGRVQLANALANAGRGREAAAQYMAASQDYSGVKRLDLIQRASMQYLISGHIDQGIEVLEVALAALGMGLALTPFRALCSLLMRRAYLRARGLGFRERALSEVSKEDMVKWDVCWTVGVGLAVSDPIRAADFQARGLALALKIGDPGRLARSLAHEASHAACGGVKSASRVADLIKRADLLSRQVGSPEVKAFVELSKGATQYLMGRYGPALGALTDAERLLREQCQGVTWELDTAQTWALWCLVYLGRFSELERRWRGLLKEARDRGDLYAIAMLNAYTQCFVRLAADHPEQALSDLLEVKKQWSTRGFYVQHHNTVLGQCYIDLYCGRADHAWERIGRAIPRYRKSLLWRVQHVRVDILQLRARCALAAATANPESRLLLTAAARDARRLEREEVEWAQGFVGLIRAGLGVAKGSIAGAVEHLIRAEAAFEGCSMALFAAAALWRRGMLLGGQEGASLVVAADKAFRQEGIQDVERMATILCF